MSKDIASKSSWSTKGGTRIFHFHFHFYINDNKITRLWRCYFTWDRGDTAEIQLFLSISTLFTKTEQRIRARESPPTGKDTQA